MASTTAELQQAGPCAPNPAGQDRRRAAATRLRRDVSSVDLGHAHQARRALLELMHEGGLRPGEALGLRLEDISYGRRRVTVRFRDDHPRGVRQKSRRERGRRPAGGPGIAGDQRLRAARATARCRHKPRIPCGWARQATPRAAELRRHGPHVRPRR